MASDQLNEYLTAQVKQVHIEWVLVRVFGILNSIDLDFHAG